MRLVCISHQGRRPGCGQKLFSADKEADARQLNMFIAREEARRGERLFVNRRGPGARAGATANLRRAWKRMATWVSPAAMNTQENREGTEKNAADPRVPPASLMEMWQAKIFAKFSDCFELRLAARPFRMARGQPHNVPDNGNGRRSPTAEEEKEEAAKGQDNGAGQVDGI